MLFAGLDPAGFMLKDNGLFNIPWFRTLRQGDAAFVDIYHSSALLGLPSPCGDIDIYLISPLMKPNCLGGKFSTKNQLTLYIRGDADLSQHSVTLTIHVVVAASAWTRCVSQSVMNSVKQWCQTVAPGAKSGPRGSGKWPAKDLRIFWGHTQSAYLSINLTQIAFQTLFFSQNPKISRTSCANCHCQFVCYLCWFGHTVETPYVATS